MNILRHIPGRKYLAGALVSAMFLQGCPSPVPEPENHRPTVSIAENSQINEEGRTFNDGYVERTVRANDPDGDELEFLVDVNGEGFVRYLPDSVDGDGNSYAFFADLIVPGENTFSYFVEDGRGGVSDVGENGFEVPVNEGDPFLFMEGILRDYIDSGHLIGFNNYTTVDANGQDIPVDFEIFGKNGKTAAISYGSVDENLEEQIAYRNALESAGKLHKYFFREPLADVENGLRGFLDDKFVDN